MNFSEYTLVSFGDSFTFGEDTVPKPDFGETVDKKLEKKYIEECNNNSYTQFLAENLGFKDSINFGLLGASNDRSMMLLESFLRSNPKKKVFIIFNFTNSLRYVQFLKVDGEKKYDIIDMAPTFEDWKTENRHPYTGINSKTVAQNWTFFRNSIQDVYNHIKQRRAVYYILSSYNVPYITFDGINDVDARMLRDNPLQYINKDKIDGCYGNFLYNDDENYIFKEQDFLNSYYEELVNETPLLNHLTIKDMKQNVNLLSYISSLGNSHNGDVDHYISNYGIHWNIDGHMEVAILLYKFINERYN
jgi:hypothetical protein